MSENERPPQPEQLEISQKMRSRLEAAVAAGGPKAEEAKELLGQTVVREENKPEVPKVLEGKKEEVGGTAEILERLHRPSVKDEAARLEQARAGRQTDEAVLEEQPPVTPEKKLEIEVYKPKPNLVVAPAVRVDQNGVVEGEARYLPEEDDKEKEKREQFNNDLDLVLDRPKPEKEAEIKEAKARLRVRGVRLANGLNLDKKEDRKAYVDRKREIMRIVKEVRAGKTLNGDDQEVLRNVKINPKELVENKKEPDVLHVDVDEEEPDLPKGEKKTAKVDDKAEKARGKLDLFLGMEPGKNRDEMLRAWLKQNPDASVEDTKLAVEALGKVEKKVAGKEMVPTDPMEYRKFMRETMKLVIDRADNAGDLNPNAIEAKLKAEISGRTGQLVVEVFPNALGKEVRDAVEAEIRARSNLRVLQLREDAYKGYDKSAALAKYINDNKGSETNSADPSFVAVETYKWLKNINNLGDPEGTTTQKVDKALSLLLRLGEENPMFSADEADFVGFGNIYDPKYDTERKMTALGLIARECGEDAKDLAYQLFQAFKEEGNYNKDHYMFVLFQFSQARKNAADSGSPVGSRRLYVDKMIDPADGQEKTVAQVAGGHEREIPCLARSPLRAQAKYGEEPAPTPAEPNKRKDLKRPDLNFRRAVDGNFLQNLDYSNIKNLPDRETFSEIKNAVKVKTAIEDIGKLGESDKSSVVGNAEKALKEIRNSGQELVESQVVGSQEISQGWLDFQLEREVENVLWEVSIRNPMNISNLSSQSRQKPNFLLPSGLADLFSKVGLETGKKGYRIINNQQHFSWLRAKFRETIDDTYRVFENEDVNNGGMTLEKGDKELIKKQELYLENKKLPTIPGEGIVDVATGVHRAAQVVTAPFDRFNSAAAGIIPDKKGKGPLHEAKKWMKKPWF